MLQPEQQPSANDRNKEGGIVFTASTQSKKVPKKLDEECDTDTDQHN
jgi:hypothetical protein